MPRALEQVRRLSEIKYDLVQSLDIPQTQRSRTPIGRAPVGQRWEQDGSLLPGRRRRRSSSHRIRLEESCFARMVARLERRAGSTTKPYAAR